MNGVRHFDPEKQRQCFAEYFEDFALPKDHNYDNVFLEMECCVHKYLYDNVISNHILTPLQSGFVQGDSTTYRLLHTYHQFCEAVDNG